MSRLNEGLASMREPWKLGDLNLPSYEFVTCVYLYENVTILSNKKLENLISRFSYEGILRL